jgi:hypothetical protein
MDPRPLRLSHHSKTISLFKLALITVVSVTAKNVTQKVENLEKTDLLFPSHATLPVPLSEQRCSLIMKAPRKQKVSHFVSIALTF